MDSSDEDRARDKIREEERQKLAHILDNGATEEEMESMVCTFLSRYICNQCYYHPKCGRLDDPKGECVYAKGKYEDLFQKICMYCNEPISHRAVHAVGLLNPHTEPIYVHSACEHDIEALYRHYIPKQKL